jgi:hypothetical protein
MNDLWKYNISSNEWTWVGGDTIGDTRGIYGSLGVSSPLNKPGGRRVSISFTDKAGNLWLFGGNGRAGGSSSGTYLNDLWKYTLIPSCTTNIWSGAINSDWNETGNWSCKTVPGPGTKVTIPATANIPSISTATTIDNLTLDGVLKLNGNSITINGNIFGNGTITGSATSDLIINGNAGAIRFTTGAAILRALKINTGASANVPGNLVITGR